MNTYYADLHIHSVVSPCAGLDMSPTRIAEAAVNAGLQIIALTDHNTTAHCRLMLETGSKHGLTVIPGAEVTTCEEIHCLCYFNNYEILDEFEEILQNSLPNIQNNPSKFGYQVVVDENENIIRYIDKLLISATSLSINELEKLVHHLGGLMVPAHVDRASYSIISQLGFFPENLPIDAIEIADFQNINFDLPKGLPILYSSDSHQLSAIGRQKTRLLLNHPSIEEVFHAITSSNPSLSIFAA